LPQIVLPKNSSVAGLNMRRWIAEVALAALAICVSLASTAHGDAVVRWDDSSQFAASSSDLAKITFEGLAAPVSYTTCFSGLNISGVSFAARETYCNPSASLTNPDLYAIDSAFGSGSYTIGSGQALIGGRAFDYDNRARWDGEVDATLPDVTSVGFDLGASGHRAATFSVDVVTVAGDHFFSVIVPAAPTGVFVGFTADDPIQSLKIINSGLQYPTYQEDFVIVDNFSYGSEAASAPLPSPLSAGLGGLICLGAGRAHIEKRRGRRRADDK